MNEFKTITAVAVISLIGSINHASDIQARAMEVLKADPLKVTPAMVEPSEREGLLSELRLAYSIRPPNRYIGSREEACVRLINMDDTNTINEIVEYHFGPKRGNRLETIPDYWKSCNNPRVVGLIDKYLLIEENARPFGREDIEVLPTSTDAARVIGLIIRNTEVFPAAVKKWAASLSTVNWEEYRDSIRRWWIQNKALIKAGSYEKTTIPAEKPQGQLPTP